MTDDFHKEGMLAQLWWLPLGVEDGEGKYEFAQVRTFQSCTGASEVLILDKNGKHARMTRGLAALCPRAGSAGVSQAADEKKIHS